jgi:hypothetical protein
MLAPNATGGSWRRREGVEPSGDLTIPRLVLKTSGTTGHLPSPFLLQGRYPLRVLGHYGGRVEIAGSVCQPERSTIERPEARNSKPEA